jgi:hypothetical protein
MTRNLKLVFSTKNGHIKITKLMCENSLCLMYIYVKFIFNVVNVMKIVGQNERYNRTYK